MAKGDIHTQYDAKNKRWVNQVEGGKQPSNSGDRKSDVQGSGREMSIERGVEHVIHKKERNKIAERNTYPRSRDPRKSRG